MLKNFTQKNKIITCIICGEVFEKARTVSYSRFPTKVWKSFRVCNSCDLLLGNAIKNKQGMKEVLRRNAKLNIS